MRIVRILAIPIVAQLSFPAGESLRIDSPELAKITDVRLDLSVSPLRRFPDPEVDRLSDELEKEVIRQLVGGGIRVHTSTEASPRFAPLLRIEIRRDSLHEAPSLAFVHTTVRLFEDVALKRLRNVTPSAGAATWLYDELDHPAVEDARETMSEHLADAMERLIEEIQYNTKRIRKARR